MSKTFLQLFEKYHPGVEERELLERSENLGVKVDTVNRRAEARLRFPSVVEKAAALCDRGGDQGGIRAKQFCHSSGISAGAG